MKRIAALVLAMSFVSFAAAQNVNFDQGVDIGKIVDSLNHNDYGYNLPDARYMGHSWYTRDCAGFTFGPSDTDIKSAKVRLRSVEYVEECYTTYTPGPNGEQIPHEHCYERPGQTWRRNAQILIKARKLYPWEREDMEVCLEGPWMRLYIDAGAYKYSVDKKGYYDVLYELTPERKIPMMPDKGGLVLAQFRYDPQTKKYIFKVNDKWAEEYAGEKVMIKVELYKDGFWFFDSYKGKKEKTFEAARSYDMSFTEDELVKKDVNVEEDADFKAMTFKGTKKYFVKWGFKRIGKISKDKYVKKGKTEMISH